MILTDKNSLYTGITLDLDRRYEEHDSDSNRLGAKFFWTCKPKQLVYLESGHTRSTASKREYEIKKMSRKAKLQLIYSDENQIQHLSPDLH